MHLFCLKQFKSFFLQHFKHHSSPKTPWLKLYKFFKKTKIIFIYSLIKNPLVFILVINSTVAQWWSIRLLTEGLQVQVLSVEQNPFEKGIFFC